MKELFSRKNYNNLTFIDNLEIMNYADIFENYKIYITVALSIKK